MSAWLQIVLVGVGTYLIRVSAIAVAGRLPEPSAATRSTMRLIAPAVLAAIVADQLFVGGRAATAAWVWWIAAAAAGTVAYRWRSPGITMAVGVALVWLLDAVA